MTTINTARPSGDSCERRPYAPHSFAVLAYKDSPFIEACIRSLMRQTVKSAVYIATSTPSEFLADVSARYGLPLHVNPRNDGIASDWSYAYTRCATPYLTLAHQDDVYAPSYAAECMAAMQRCPGALLAFTDYVEIKANRIHTVNRLLFVKRLMLTLPFLFGERVPGGWLRSLALTLGNPVCCPSVVYNKQRIGGFRFDPSFSMNLDWEALIRLTRKKGSFVYIKKRLLTRRIHAGAESANALETRARHEEDARIFRYFWPRPMVRLILGLYAGAYRSD